MGIVPWESRKQVFAEIDTHCLLAGTVYTNSQGAKKLANNLLYYSGTKHISACNHIVRNTQSAEEIQMKYPTIEKCLQ